MTVTLQKYKCDWCGTRTSDADDRSTFSDITDEAYCSSSCREKAEREIQAECSHSTVKIVKAEEDAGVCEECGREMVKDDDGWREW